MGNISDKSSSSRTNGVSSSHKPEFLIKLGQVLEKKSLEEEGKQGITKNVFKKYLSKASETTGIALFDFFVINDNPLVITGTDKEDCSNNDVTLTKEKFVNQAEILLNCLNETLQLEYYIKVFARGKEDMKYSEFSNLVAASYEVAQFAHHTSVVPDNLLSALSKAVMHGKSKTMSKYVLNWCCENCPRMVTWLHRYLTHTLTVGYATIPRNEETEEDDNETPILDSPNKSSCATLHPALIWMLSCSLPTSFTKSSNPSSPVSPSKITNPHKFLENLMSGTTPTHWIPLFNTDEHGTSLNRFKHYAFDYHGPTLLFVTTDDQSLFCVASDEEWRDSMHFYGSIDCMCLQLLPEYKIVERGPNLIYFNLTSNGFPMGLQVGTDHLSRALTVDSSLENVEHRRIPYRLKSLEVWGCGPATAKHKQQETKRQASKDVDKIRKVNRNALDWQDNPDRYLLEMGGSRPNYAKFEKETQNQT